MSAWLIASYADGDTHKAVYDPILQRCYGLCGKDFRPIHGRDDMPITLDTPPDCEQVCPECAKLVIR